MSIVNHGTTNTDKLIAHPDRLLTKVITLAAGGGAMVRGTILGKTTIGAATRANAGGGTGGANTGNGTLTLDSTTPVLANAQVGVYTVRIIKAAVADPAALAVAEIKDPKGNIIGQIGVATTPGTTFASQVKFVILDGSTPFVVGDGFNVTVAAGSGQYKKVSATAVDGSAVADCILSHAADATAAVKATAYKTGIFNRQALVVANGDTVAAHEEELRIKEIHIKDEIYSP